MWECVVFVEVVLLPEDRLRNSRSLPVNQDWLDTGALPPQRTWYGLPDMLLLVAASSIKDSVEVTSPFFCK